MKTAPTLYGELPRYQSERNEWFAKLTATPTRLDAFNFSYRDSHRLDVSSLFGQASTATTGTGYESWQTIITADGSWVINPKSFANFKYTHFENPNTGPARLRRRRRDQHDTRCATRLEQPRHDRAHAVPTPVAGADAYNAFIRAADRTLWLHVANGVKTGGGLSATARNSTTRLLPRRRPVRYNLTLGSHREPRLHAGYQWLQGSEDLERSSNGWGAITVPGGRLASAGINGIPATTSQPFQQQSHGAVPAIHSEFVSQSIEVNDTIRWGNLTFNVGRALQQRHASTARACVKTRPQRQAS